MTPEKLEYHRQWRQKNREKLNRWSREYAKLNPDKVKESKRKYTRTHAERCKNYRLQYEYGITKKQFDHMVISQNNQCAICSKQFADTKDTCVDHNHAINTVRQLLCKKCNHAIGLFDENVLILSKAVDYLNRWNG